jgi:hypothetical protein
MPDNGATRYTFKLSAPLCGGASAGAHANDSYLLTMSETTLPQSIFRGAMGLDGYIVQNATPYTPRAVPGFMLLDIGSISLARIDEVVGRSDSGGTPTSSWPAALPAGDTVIIEGIVRNIGIDSDGVTGGELWVRLIDVDTGLAPATGYTGDVIISGPIGVVGSGTVAHNDENSVPIFRMDFTMPASDIHLRVECGHATTPGTLSLTGSPALLSGAVTVDDWAPFEVRVL